MTCPRYSLPFSTHSTLGTFRGALDALPAVVDAVAGRVPVLMDGGIRGGAVAANPQTQD